MSNQDNILTRGVKDQVMVSLPHFYQAAESATINGAVAFRDFYEIIRIDYPELPEWPEDDVDLAIGESHNLNITGTPTPLSRKPSSSTPSTHDSDNMSQNTTTVIAPDEPHTDYHDDVNDDDDDDDDKVPLDLLIERPPLKRRSSTRDRFGGPLKHSTGPSTGYVDILTPIVEGLEDELQRLNLKRYEKGGARRRETWVPPVSPGSPGTARGSYSLYYEYISGKGVGEEGAERGYVGKGYVEREDVEKKGLEKKDVAGE